MRVRLTSYLHKLCQAREPELPTRELELPLELKSQLQSELELESELESEPGAGDSTGAGAKLLCFTLSAAIYIHFPLTDIRFPAADSRCFVRLHFHKHVLGF